MLDRKQTLNLIVPFFAGADALDSFCEHFLSQLNETKGLVSALIFVNGHGDELELRQKIDRWVERFHIEKIACDCIHAVQRLNRTELLNLALDRCVKDRADALLVNADVRLATGCIQEMREVSTADPVIGFVNPRSNRGWICSLPLPTVPSPDEIRSDDLAYHRYRELSECLDRWHFIPSAAGFCLLIRWFVLSELGLLDAACDPENSTEHDLCMRANRCGFRVALANKAFAYNTGLPSLFPPQRELARNELSKGILEQRYPEFRKALNVYLDSARFQYEKVMPVLRDLPGRPLKLVIDLSGLRFIHNGTSEAQRAIVNALAQLKDLHLRLYAIGTPLQVTYHQINKEIEIIPCDTNQLFDVGLHIGQPFQFEVMRRLSRCSIYNVYMMLDTIAYDCFYHNDFCHPLVEDLWKVVAEYSDGLLFISEFTRQQMNRRFPVALDKPQLTCHLSLFGKDYEDSVSSVEKISGSEKPTHVLLVGNPLEHKFLRRTLEHLLYSSLQVSYSVFGLEKFPHPNVTTIKSGTITDLQVSRIFRSADVIIYPSLYEGFGFPIVKGLANGKTVFARDSSLNCEIRDRWSGKGRLILYETTRELPSLLESVMDNLSGSELTRGEGLPHGKVDTEIWSWQSVAEALRHFMAQVVANDKAAMQCQKRLQFFDTVGNFVRRDFN